MLKLDEPFRKISCSSLKRKLLRKLMSIRHKTLLMAIVPIKYKLVILIFYLKILLLKKMEVSK